MWELDYKESWAPKNWCFWTVVLETIESPLDCKEIQPISPKGNQSWIFVRRTDAKAEIPILGPPDVKNWLSENDPDVGKDLRQKTGMTGDEMDGWPHHLMDISLSKLSSWLSTGKPGVLQSTELQMVGHYWGTEVSWATFNAWEVFDTVAQCFLWNCFSFGLQNTSFFPVSLNSLVNSPLLNPDLLMLVWTGLRRTLPFFSGYIPLVILSDLLV